MPGFSLTVIEAVPFVWNGWRRAPDHFRGATCAGFDRELCETPDMFVIEMVTVPGLAVALFVV